ncbi:MAG: flagellar basal body rod protein FlgB [Pirellulales bacterium]
MWKGWLSDTSIPALEQSLAFAQRRHMLLAGNIANIDVPDYRTRDLSEADFQTALKESIESPNTHQSPGVANSVSPAEKVRDVRNQVLYLDGSDISLEQQITQISKNQLMHDTAIALMKSQFQTLRSAITESANV